MVAYFKGFRIELGGLFEVRDRVRFALLSEQDDPERIEHRRTVRGELDRALSQVEGPRLPAPLGEPGRVVERRDVVRIEREQRVVLAQRLVLAARGLQLVREHE